jgi:hypothetical protein
MYRLEMCTVPLSKRMVAPGSEYGGDINALKYRCISEKCVGYLYLKEWLSLAASTVAILTL